MATITHYPKISVTAEHKESLEKRLPKLLEIADNNCMISNSIRNNVENSSVNSIIVKIALVSP